MKLIYHLVSIPRRARLRLKTKLSGSDPVSDSLIPVWPGANWLEREIFDLMGIRFTGQPDLRRILLPDDWEGHPLRRDFPTQGFRDVPSTYIPAFRKPTYEHNVETPIGAAKTMVLNMGPQHPSTHGVLRIALELDGETVVKAVPDLGYLHTGIEKSCEDKTYSQAITLNGPDGLLESAREITWFIAWRLKNYWDWKFPSARSMSA